MKCIWCGKQLTTEEVGNLCPVCEQVSTGVPGLSSEQLDSLPFGVIELNKEGEIIAFNQSEVNLSRRSKVDAVGRNFFTEVAPCANVREYRDRFREFLEKGGLSEQFNYIYYFGPHAVAVEIAFIRINEQMGLVLSRRIES